MEVVYASLWSVGLVVLIVHIVAGSLFGAALATWTRFPLWLGILLGILVPVIGPIVAAIIATARRTPEARRLHRPRRLRVNAIVLAVPALMIFVALVLPWWIVRINDSSPIPLLPTGRFLDTVIILTLIVVVAVAVLVAALGMVHLGAALLTAPLVLWAFAIGLLGAVTKAVQDALAGVADIAVTVGDVTRFVGLTPESLPLAGLGVDVDALDLTDFAGSASIEFGAGWYLMLAAAIVLALWVVWAAFVPARQPRAVDARSSVPPSAPAPPTPAPPEANPWSNFT